MYFMVLSEYTANHSDLITYLANRKSTPACLKFVIFWSNLRKSSPFEAIESTVELSDVTSNFGPPQELKNGPLIPHLDLYGLKLGHILSGFPQLRTLRRHSYATGQTHFYTPPSRCAAADQKWPPSSLIYL